MNLKKDKILSIVLCLFSLLPVTLVNAAQIINANLLEFSLSTQNQTTHFDFSTYTHNTKSDQLGINWYEPFSSYFHAGLELGYIDMSQIENSLSSAQFTTGQYAGLLLRFLPVESPLFSLTMNLNYRYNRTEGESTDQKTQFFWNETVLYSEINFQPTSHIGLMAAAEYQIVDGEQRDSGNITQITPFRESKKQGYRFGLNFTTNRTGIVGLEWFTGFKEGTRLYFLRKF